jgi:hypothetical protein
MSVPSGKPEKKGAGQIDVFIKKASCMIQVQYSSFQLFSLTPILTPTIKVSNLPKEHGPWNFQGPYTMTNNHVPDARNTVFHRWWIRFYLSSHVNLSWLTDKWPNGVNLGCFKL